MLALVVGDLHIPIRAAAIPPIFGENLSGGKIDKIFCTGNLCTKDELQYLRNFCPDIQTVRGEFDDDDLPDNEYVLDSIAGFKIGLVSALSIIPPNDKERLAAKARELDVDILAFGGGHRAGVFEEDGVLYLNPGSATGAFSAATPNARPAFILIRFQGSTAIAFTYVLGEDGTLAIEKVKFTKNGDDDE
jgi:putative phosphoesterase